MWKIPITLRPHCRSLTFKGYLRGTSIFLYIVQPTNICQFFSILSTTILKPSLYLISYTPSIQLQPYPHILTLKAPTLSLLESVFLLLSIILNPWSWYRGPRHGKITLIRWLTAGPCERSLLRLKIWRKSKDEFLWSPVVVHSTKTHWVVLISFLHTNLGKTVRGYIFNFILRSLYRACIITENQFWLNIWFIILWLH